MLSSLSGFAISPVSSYLVSDILTYVCPAEDIDRLDAGINRVAKQRADKTIFRVRSMLERLSKSSAEDLELNPLLQLLVDVWRQLQLDDGLLNHCNERKV